MNPTDETFPVKRLRYSFHTMCIYPTSTCACAPMPLQTRKQTRKLNTHIHEIPQLRLVNQCHSCKELFGLWNDDLKAESKAQCHYQANQRDKND